MHSYLVLISFRSALLSSPHQFMECNLIWSWWRFEMQSHLVPPYMRIIMRYQARYLSDRSSSVKKKFLKFFFHFLNLLSFNYCNKNWRTRVHRTENIRIRCSHCSKITNSANSFYCANSEQWAHFFVLGLKFCVKAFFGWKFGKI